MAGLNLTGRGNAPARRETLTSLARGAVSLAVAMLLVMAIFLFGANGVVLSKAFGSAFAALALAALLLAGPSAASPLASLMAAAAAALVLAPVGNDILVSSAASAAATVAVWICGRTAGLGARTPQFVWSALIWVALIWYAYSLYLRHLGDGGPPPASAYEAGVTLHGSLPTPRAEAALLGLLALTGWARVVASVKSMKMSGLSRSGMFDEILSRALGGFLLFGLCLASLVMSGVKSGLILCLGACLFHVWLELRGYRRNRNGETDLKAFELPALAASLVTLVAGVATGLFYPSDVSAAPTDASAINALQATSVFLNDFLASPLLGHGLGASVDISRAKGDLVDVLAMSRFPDAPGLLLRPLLEIGAVGLLALMAGIFSLHWGMTRRLSQRSGSSGVFARLAIAGSAFMLANSLVDAAAFSNCTMWIYAYLLGLGSGSTWPRKASNA